MGRAVLLQVGRTRQGKRNMFSRIPNCPNKQELLCGNGKQVQVDAAANVIKARMTAGKTIIVVVL